MHWDFSHLLNKTNGSSGGRRSNDSGFARLVASGSTPPPKDLIVWRLKWWLGHHPSTVAQLKIFLPTWMSDNSFRMKLGPLLTQLYADGHVAPIGSVVGPNGGRGADVWAGRPWLCKNGFGAVGSGDALCRVDQREHNCEECRANCTVWKARDDGWISEDLYTEVVITQLAHALRHGFWFRWTNKPEQWFPVQDWFVCSTFQMRVGVCPKVGWQPRDIERQIKGDGAQDFVVLLVAADREQMRYLQQQIGTNRKCTYLTTIDDIKRAQNHKISVWFCGAEVELG